MDSTTLVFPDSLTAGPPVRTTWSFRVVAFAFSWMALSSSELGPRRNDQEGAEMAVAGAAPACR